MKSVTEIHTSIIEIKLLDINYSYFLKGGQNIEEGYGTRWQSCNTAPIEF